MQAQRLVLYPRDPERAPRDADRILDGLREIGLIAGPWRGDRHLAGPRFLELIPFLGCSPHVRLEPNPGEDPQDAGQGFCHVQVPDCTPMPRFLYGTNTKTPRCPACREAMTGWRASIGAAAPGGPPTLRCEDCGEPWATVDLAWRRSACTARFIISVWDIFEGEARPARALLEQLDWLDAGPWDFCYLRD
jgi:hypothetical protein